MKKLISGLGLLIGGASVIAGVALIALYWCGPKVGVNPPREVALAGSLAALLGCVVYAVPRRGRTWAAWTVLVALSAGTIALGQTADRWVPTVAESNFAQKAGEWVTYLASLATKPSDAAPTDATDDEPSPAVVPVVGRTNDGGSATKSAVDSANTEAGVKPSPTGDGKASKTAAGKTEAPGGTKNSAASGKAADASDGMTPGADGKEITSAEFMRDHIEPALKAISAYEGYTCTFEKREWAKPLLGNFRLTNEQATLKVRHEPFAAYLHFEKPAAKFGTEALYAEGLHDGNVIAHSEENFIKKLAGTVRVPPTDAKVMADNRYPITNIGMKNLMLKFKKESEEFKEALKEVSFTLHKDQEIDKRPCKVIEIWNANPEKYPRASARLYIDKEWNVPTGFESYEMMNGKSKIVEKYRYTNLKFNPGLKDLDFDPKNPAYKYP